MIVCFLIAFCLFTTLLVSSHLYPLQDDHWADNATIITATSERSASRDDNLSALGGDEIEELHATPSVKSGGRRLAALCRVLLGCALGLPPLLTPPAFIIFPRLLLWMSGVVGQAEKNPDATQAPAEESPEGLCAQLCDGAHLALAVKLLLLLPSSWALFLREPLGGARVPRASRPHWLLRVLVLLCAGCHWLLYGVRGVWRPGAEPQAIVGLATSCTDAMLWLQYAGLTLLEVATLNHHAYCLKVTRSTDGESRCYNVGRLR